MKLSLRKRLLTAFIIIITAGIVISGISYFTINGMRNTLLTTFENDFRPYQTITNARSLFTQLVREFDLMIEMPEELDRHARKAAEFRENMLAMIEQTMDFDLTAEGRSILQDVASDIERIVQAREEMIEAVRRGRMDTAEMVYRQITGLADRIESGISDFQNLQERHFSNAVQGAQADATRSTTIILIVLLIMLIISVVTVMTVFRLVNTGIRQVLKSVQELSVSTNQIVATTSQLTSNSVQTGTAVNQVTSTVEETRQTARISNDKAKYVSESAQNVYHVSTGGKKVIEQTIEAMNSIQSEMNQVARSIIKLSEQSLTVGQIIGTVNDLAEATNILSVNASIEAARAGEHGKGFSVVAQEIRSLADRSKQATSRISEILSEIQKATNSSVLITEQAGKRVDAGVQQSLQAKEAIEVLSANITEAAQAATQIAASSSQQLAGMDQMAEGMTSINQATQQNVDSLKELESAMRNLHELGERLKEVVNVL